MYRHHPQTQKLEELVDSGAVGELRQIRTAFTFTLDLPEDVRWRPELEGGSLLDLGCYCVSVSRLLGGEPERVYGRQRLAPTGIDVGFTGTLEFSDEVSAQFHCAFDLPAESYVEAIGTIGKARVIEPFRCKDPHVDLNGRRIDVEDVDRYLLQLENLSEAIRGEAEPLLGREDAYGAGADDRCPLPGRRTGSAVGQFVGAPSVRPRKVSCSRRPPALERTIASPISDAR